MCVRVFIYGVQHVEMPTCIFLRGGEGFASSRRGTLGVAPADRSGDKAAETELTTCWTVLATDVPEQITGRMRWHFLKMWMCTFKLWCEHDFPRKERKKNALFVWFTWSPLQSSYILYAYPGPYFCCCCFVIVSVDLGTFGGMRNEGKKMARIVESGFDDMDDACGMSAVETGGVCGHNNTRWYSSLRGQVWPRVVERWKDAVRFQKMRSNKCLHPKAAVQMQRLHAVPKDFFCLSLEQIKIFFVV